MHHIYINIHIYIYIYINIDKYMYIICKEVVLFAHVLITTALLSQEVL